MKAVILAAGEGRRLRPHTEDRPKCLVEVAGRPILDYEIDALQRAGIEDISIVTGYRSDRIEERGFPTFHNPRFDRTNMVTSLMAAKSLFDGTADILVSYADIIYEVGAIDALVRSDAAVSLAVNTRWRQLWEIRMSDPLSDAETLILDGSGDVIELGKKPNSYDEIQGQYMGLLKFAASVTPKIAETYRGLDPAGNYDGKDLDNMYMTSFLQHWIDHVTPIRAVPIDGAWLEVDTVEDLEIYSRLERDGRLARYCRL